MLVDTSELKTRNGLYKNYQKYILYLQRVLLNNTVRTEQTEIFNSILCMGHLIKFL